jgi:lipoprotein-releasing system ATP-binding protein
MSDAKESLTPVLSAHNLGKVYTDGNDKISVLKGVDLEVLSGEMLAIIGASGSGKSTLLHLLGCLDKPSSGELTIVGNHTANMKESQRCRIRNEKLGFVYQFHHLLPEFTALENVAMPLLLRGEKLQRIKEQAEQILCRVGLNHRLNFRPGQLSGGEKQRVAIARALVTKPSCVLADEPTGNCDQHTAAQLRDLMVALNDEYNTAFVVVTHDPTMAQHMDRTLVLKQGALLPA